MSFLDRLQSLDFSANDAVVYRALLKHGPCQAGPLISETGFHRNIVYTSLAHLVDRKLVAERLVRGKAQFMATDPTFLADIFADKAALAARVAEEIRIEQAHPAQEITVHRGNEEYLSLLVSLLKRMPRGSKKYVLGTGGEAFMRVTMRPIWNAYHEVARSQDVRIHMIGYESQRGAIEPWIQKESLYNVHYLSPTLENPSGIHIYPDLDTVLNIIYSDDHEPVTAIKIGNAALARGYLQLFHNLWGMGRA